MNYKIVQIPTANLKAYSGNARIHPQAQLDNLTKSLESFGFINPVIVDDANTILAGHGRVMAAETLGLEVVPCIIVEGLSEVDKKAYILADNGIASQASWDMPKLVEEVSFLMDDGYDISSLGLDIDMPVSDEGLTPEPKKVVEKKVKKCPSCGEILP